MSGIKVTVEETKGLEMVLIEEIRKGAFDVEVDAHTETNRMIIAFGANKTYHPTGPPNYEAFSFEGKKVVLPILTKVHPRRDIDKWLAAQKPEEAPVAEAVAVSKLVFSRWYVVDGEQMQFINRDTFDGNVVFNQTGSGTMTFSSGCSALNTIEAAEGEMTFRRVYKYLGD